MIKKLLLFLIILFLSNPSFAQTKILILGASITWGCVSNCSPNQIEPGYVPRLRALLPNYEIKALTLFSSGVADWEPESVSISSQSLIFPTGFGEFNLGQNINLWNFFAKPNIKDFEPDYVLLVMGAGDIIRFLRSPPSPWTPIDEYGMKLDRLAHAIVNLGSTPVLVFDTPFAYPSGAAADPIFLGYRTKMLEICSCEHIKCGPDIFSVINRVDHFIGTDAIHFNAAGHQAMAEILANWFINNE